MNKELVEIINAASHYPQVFTICKQGRKPSPDPLSERITIRLSPIRSAGDGLIEGEVESGCKCDSPLCPAHGEPRQSPEREPNTPVAVIDLNKLNRSDQILIETTHSVYSFTVIDPTIPSGRLIGGVLGNRLVEAALIPSRIERNNAKPAHMILTAGASFSFLIEWGDSVRRMTTSSVTSLVLRKTGGDRGVAVVARERVRLEHLSGDTSDR